MIIYGVRIKGKFTKLPAKLAAEHGADGFQKSELVKAVARVKLTETEAVELEERERTRDEFDQEVARRLLNGARGDGSLAVIDGTRRWRAA